MGSGGKGLFSRSCHIHLKDKVTSQNYVDQHRSLSSKVTSTLIGVEDASIYLFIHPLILNIIYWNILYLGFNCILIKYLPYLN